MQKNNEIPPNPLNSDQNEQDLNEYHILEEETERLSPVTKVDPYLAKERQKQREEKEAAEIDLINKDLKKPAFIESAIEKKDTGGEEWKDERPREEKRPWYLRVAAMFGIAGALMVPHKSEAKPAEDTLSKDNKTIAANIKTPKDSLETKTGGITKITAVEKGVTIGGVTIETLALIPHHDKSIEVCVAYFSGSEKDKDKVGKMLRAMKEEGGWEPAPRGLMDEAASENQSQGFSERMPWVMSLSPEGDDDDTRATEGGIVTTEEQIGEVVVKNKEDQEKKDTLPVWRKKVERRIPQHAVFPTRTKLGPNRFELDQGITYSEDSYGYIFYREATTTQYESGLAKTK